MRDYSYDRDGDRVSVTGLGYTETFAYDRSDRLETSVFNYGSCAVTTTYMYDKDGNRATMTLGTATTHYSYDAAERLTGILDPEGQNTTFAYDHDSRQTRETDASGVVTSRTYDKASRLTGIWTNTSGAGVLESFVYAYDRASLRTSERDVQSGATTTTSYAYDKVHRLYNTTVGSNATTDMYDAVGNLYNETKSSTETFTYDADSELLNASFSSTNYVKYSYDKDGNRILATASGGATTSYAYDYENRLVSVSGGCTYGYAPTGERVTSTCSSGTTDLAYDANVRGGSNLLATYSPSGSQTARYLQGKAINTPVEVYEGGAHYAYQRDGLGSVRMLTGSSQNATDTYGYDAWGNVVSQSGGLANPLQYTGSIRDSPSGLYDNRARFYDSSANGGHRFVSQDSAACAHDPTSRYAYVRDNPLNFIDPTGHGCDFWTKLKWDAACDVASVLGTTGVCNLLGMGPADPFSDACSLIVGLAMGSVCETLIGNFVCHDTNYVGATCSGLASWACEEAINSQTAGLGPMVVSYVCSVLADFVCGVLGLDVGSMYPFMLTIGSGMSVGGGGSRSTLYYT